jgi:hypothetical protein
MDFVVLDSSCACFFVCNAFTFVQFFDPVCYLFSVEFSFLR